MKKLLHFFCYFLFTLTILSYGCSTFNPLVLKVINPGPTSNSIILKLDSIKTSEIIDENNHVGIIVRMEKYVKSLGGLTWAINPRSEEDVYSWICANTMLALENEGIIADLLIDEDDPRLEQIGIIFHLTYSEYIGKKKVFNPNVIGFYSYVPVIKSSYYITIYDTKTKNEIHHYNDLEKGINALKELL